MNITLRRYYDAPSAMIISVIVVLASGCVTTTTKNGREIANRPSEFSKQIHAIGERFSEYVAAVTPKDGCDPIIWEWAVGIPRSATKGEAPAVLPDEAVAAFIPSLSTNDIGLVSGGSENPVVIQAINGCKVQNLDDLNSAIEKITNMPAKNRDTVVELCGGSGGSKVIPVSIARNDVLALAHACLPDHSQIRIVSDGNPWVLIRDNAVRCKVMLRKERSRNLVHLAMSLKVCWDSPQQLPASVAVSCNDQPLSCLTVPQVLDQLYGDRKKRSRQTVSTVSFNEIAEHDEFVTPVNYRKLEARLANDQRLANSRPYPAFATVGGHAYPGPPVLGDARALSAFMLQPHLFSPQNDEQVGWVVFDGSNQPNGEVYRVVMDLGSGPVSVEFKVPNVDT